VPVYNLFARAATWRADNSPHANVIWSQSIAITALT